MTAARHRSRPPPLLRLALWCVPLATLLACSADEPLPPPSIDAECTPASLEQFCHGNPGSHACTWAALHRTGADASSLAELTGTETEDLREALVALFPRLEDKELVDERVPSPDTLVMTRPQLPDYEVPHPIDWSVDPFGKRSWRVWFQSLSWLDHLYTSGDDDLTRPAYVVVSWAERVLPAEPPLEMTWRDRIMAARLARVWRFLQAYIDSDDRLNVRVIHGAAKILTTHLYGLAAAPCYAPSHNHGFMQDLELMRRSLAMETLAEREELFELGERRVVSRQVEPAVTRDGVHRENSPHYHLVFTKLLSEALAEIYHEHGREPPAELLSARDRLVDTLPHLLQPDGTFPQLGDTPNWDRTGKLQAILHEAASSFPLEPDSRDALRYVASGGESGSAPGVVDRVFPDGGYAAFRRSWTHPAAEQITAHFTCARLTSIHYHRDETSFEIYGYGKPLVVDSGMHNADDSEPLTTHQYSTAAHNVLTVDGRGYGAFDSQPQIVGYGKPRRDFVWVQGSHEYFRDLGVRAQRRTFAYAKPHHFIVHDALRADGAHLYEQHFHLHPSLTELSRPGPNTVVARAADGEGPSVVLVTGAVPDTVRTERGGNGAQAGWYFPELETVEPAYHVAFDYERPAGEVHLPVLIALVPPGTDPEAALPSFEHSRDEGGTAFRWTSEGEPRRAVVDAAPL